MPSPIQTNAGLFIPTTNIWDVGRLYEIDINSNEFKELIIRLYQNINSIALSLNLKQSGYFYNQEFVNGQVWFPNANNVQSGTIPLDGRQGFTTVVNFGALPNATTKSVPHGVSGNTYTYTATRVWAAATNYITGKWLPLPYASTTLNQNIILNVDPVNVNITTAIDYSAYTACQVVIEYLKN